LVSCVVIVLIGIHPDDRILFEKLIINRLSKKKGE
jgi:hypothetical protein